MSFTKLIRTASLEANVLAASAGVLLLVKILFLNRFPGWFFGVYELGIIIEAVLASVLASYVFYLLVVRVKEESDRDILRPYIEKHSKRILGECASQVSEIAKASGVPLNFQTSSGSDFKAAFSKIAPYSQAPLVISTNPVQYADWLRYFSFHNDHSRAGIRKLFDQLLFLDPAHVSILTDIDDSGHFSSISAVVNRRIGNSDLEVFSEPFYEYCLLCRRLDAYLVTKFGIAPSQP